MVLLLRQEKGRRTTTQISCQSNHREVLELLNWRKSDYMAITLLCTLLITLLISPTYVVNLSILFDLIPFAKTQSYMKVTILFLEFVKFNGVYFAPHAGRSKSANSIFFFLLIVFHLIIRSFLWIPTQHHGS